MNPSFLTPGALAGLHRDLGGGGVPPAQGQATAAAMQLEAAARIPLAAHGAQRFGGRFVFDAFSDQT